jgi:hypothetical protein
MWRVPFGHVSAPVSPQVRGSGRGADKAEKGPPRLLTTRRSLSTDDPVFCYRPIDTFDAEGNFVARQVRPLTRWRSESLFTRIRRPHQRVRANVVVAGGLLSTDALLLADVSRLPD